MPKTNPSAPALTLLDDVIAAIVWFLAVPFALAMQAVYGPAHGQIAEAA
jgi:hypothetical protein